MSLFVLNRKDYTKGYYYTATNVDNAGDSPVLAKYPDGRWRMETDYRSEHYTAEELRELADYLDRLNKEEP